MKETLLTVLIILLIVTAPGWINYLIQKRQYNKGICPHCGHKLQTKLYMDNENVYHFIYYCPHCNKYKFITEYNFNKINKL